MEVEAQADNCQISSTQDEEVAEEEASPIVVFAVYSELTVTAQDLTHASMASSTMRVDVERQRPLAVKRHRSPHRPKTTVETSPRK